MTPNKLPPLPDYDWDAAHQALESMDDYARMDTGVNPYGPYSVLRDLLTKAKGWHEAAEALRQSQSLPAGAVAGLVGKWRADGSRWNIGQGGKHLRTCADELEQALRADAREKGEAVAWGVRSVHAEKGDLWMCDFGLATISRDNAERFAEWANEHRAEDGPFIVVGFATQPAQASEDAMREAIELTVRGIESGNIKSPLVTRKVDGDYVTESLHTVLVAALATSSQETASE